MEIPLISKRQFNRIKKYLPDTSIAEKIDRRIAISCGIWIIKKGYSWSELPKKYGKFDTIRKRFCRWNKKRKLKEAFNGLFSHIKKRSSAMLHSTIIKAHRTVSSMRSDKLPRQIGRSVGGLTTKIYILLPH